MEEFISIIDYPVQEYNQQLSSNTKERNFIIPLVLSAACIVAFIVLLDHLKQDVGRVIKEKDSKVQ